MISAPWTYFKINDQDKNRDNCLLDSGKLLQKGAEIHYLKPMQFHETLEKQAGAAFE